VREPRARTATLLSFVFGVVPIVIVQCVQERTTGPYAEETVQSLSDALGQVFGSDPGTTWLKMQYLRCSDYADNAGERDFEIRPTFVEILKQTLQEEDILANEATEIADVGARILSRPKGNSHVIYLPEGAGRVAFGGNLVRRQTDKGDA